MKMTDRRFARAGGNGLNQIPETEGHEIFRLVRHAPASKTEVEWSPDRYSIALARIEGFDAVVNLAGESIAEGRWTDDKKRRIRESRVKGTKLLGDALANLAIPPKTLFALRQSATTGTAVTNF